MIDTLKSHPENEMKLKELALHNLGLEEREVSASDISKKKLWNEMVKIMIEVKQNNLVGIKYLKCYDGVQTVIFLKNK